MLHTGSKAPPIEVTDLAGSPWRLDAALEHGPVLLMFFKISCPTCRLTLPFLQRLAERGRPDSPALLAISQDDAPVTQDFLSRFGIQVPAAVDKAWDFPASNAFRITHVPSMFLVERDGTISTAIHGFVKTRPRGTGRPVRRQPVRAVGNGTGTSTWLNVEELTPVRSLRPLLHKIRFANIKPMANIGDVFGAASAIVQGMGITFKEMMAPTVTENYPDEPP